MNKSGKQPLSDFQRFWSAFLMTLSVGLMLFAGGLFAYQQNFMGFQEWVVTKYGRPQVNPLKGRQVVLSKDRQRIRNEVMRPTEQKSGLNKQGFVSIPNLGILLPIFDDSYSDKALAKGANVIQPYVSGDKSKRLPSVEDANYSLAGHNFDDGRTQFSALQQHVGTVKGYYDYANKQFTSNNWQNGKKVYIATYDKILTYEIFNQEIVPKEAVNRIIEPHKFKQLNIISCLSPWDNNRILTKARQVDVQDWKNAPSDVVNLFDLKKQPTNAHTDVFNKGTEEGANGRKGEV